MLQTQWASLIWAPDTNNIRLAKKLAWIFFGKIFVGGASGKESSCQCRRHKRCEFHLWVGKFPQRRAWQPSPVFLPGESHWQRSLAGYKSIGWQIWTQLKRLSTQHYRKNPNEFWLTQYFSRMVKRGQPGPMYCHIHHPNLKITFWGRYSQYLVFAKEETGLVGLNNVSEPFLWIFPINGLIAPKSYLKWGEGANLLLNT